MMMTLEKLMETYPDLEPYVRYMPEELKTRFTVRKFPAGCIIHQKHTDLKCFGIICEGDHRVINEFENGNVYMIEKNEPIDFIGEVTILAGMQETSVTIETLTPCTAMMFSRTDFEFWISRDIHFLRMVSQKVAFKLYRSSYNRGARLFYPPNFLLLDYILKYVKNEEINEQQYVIIKRTREQLQEELGMTIKTINRTISKLKESGLISSYKGKIKISLEQYERGKKELKHYVR